ncbi:MAG: F0F1 ATP synthase subunit A [Coriobacteriales bacterium]|jgi:F-type H+-transporting ATPase subunit a|nr:F0F1 ATP synthase subunit A [Coriobacteriales bacterium]
MEEFDSELSHLMEDLKGMDMFDFGWGSITPFTVWTFVALIVVFLLIWHLRSRISFIPKLSFASALEVAVDYIKREIGENLLGPSARQHTPFLLTIFFFILAGNLIGLIPGAKSATGTMSVTLVLAVASFLYFNIAGMRHAGVFRYIISIAPAGIPPGLNVVVWAIEAFSMTLRMFSLSVRLFANMFAGHLMLGLFALMSSMYFLPMIQQFTIDNLVSGVLSGLWLLILIVVYAMEFMVAFIQAYVFTLLSGVYIQLATSEH